jgi:hypothetical protein
MSLIETSLLVSLSFLAGDEPPTDHGAASKANAVEVRLADGSRLRMTILQDRVEVVTRYGKLTVPSGEIRSIEFGVRFGEGTGKRIEDAIKNLADENYQVREKAAAELEALGPPAYKALLRAAKNPELEVASRAKTILENLRQKHSEERLQARDEDTVRTAEFTIIGRVATPTIKASTPIFGETELRLSDLRGIRWLGAKAEVEVIMDGAKYASSATEWLDTGVEVTADDELAISASGQVDLMGNGNAQFMSGPNGINQWGGVRVNPVVPIAPGNAVNQPGVLIGRIGENGPVFVVGESYKGIARKDGRLYLQIGTSIWARNGNGHVSGSYKVNIGGGREVGAR